MLSFIQQQNVIYLFKPAIISGLMNKLLITIIVLAIVALAFIFVPLNNSGFFSLSESSEAIKIGALLPLTGNLAFQSEDVVKGLNLAVEEINSKGGIKGHKVEIVYEDYSMDFTKAVQGYQKLTKFDWAKYIIVSYGDAVLAVAPLAEQDKVISFAVGSASPKISNAGDFTFRNNLQTKDEVKEMANFIYTVDGLKNIGAVVINTDSGNSYFDAFKKEYELLGGFVKIVEKYNKDETNYSTQVFKLKSSDVDGIFFMLSAEMLVSFLNEIKQQEYSPKLYGGYYTENRKVLELAGENAENIIYTNFYNPQSSKTKSFISNFSTKFGSEPNPFSALAYDNLYMLKKAIEKCDNVLDSVCAKNNLYKVEIDGVSGKTSFDKNGDAIKQIFFKTIKDGKFVLLEK